jgi:small subunit ribosomal protein S13
MYILNTEVKSHKRAKTAMTGIYGVGGKKAQKICKEFGISDKALFKDLSPDKINRIVNFIEENYPHGRLFKESKIKNIRHLAEIRTVRGIRHRNKLPVRGQRTHTNARTKKRT